MHIVIKDVGVRFPPNIGHFYPKFSAILTYGNIIVPILHILANFT